jgi:WD40 repeat protein
MTRRCGCGTWRAPKQCARSKAIRWRSVPWRLRLTVSASYDATLRLWDLESRQTLHTLEGHTNWVRAVAVTPDGRRAVSASDDRTLRLWDLESGKEIVTFTGESGMDSCAIAPDGQTIIGGDESGRVHFLRLVEADETKPLINRR